VAQERGKQVHEKPNRACVGPRVRRGGARPADSERKDASSRRQSHQEPSLVEWKNRGPPPSQSELHKTRSCIPNTLDRALSDLPEAHHPSVKTAASACHWVPRKPL